MRLKHLGTLLACLLTTIPGASPAAEIHFPLLTGPIVDLVDEIPSDRQAQLEAGLREFKTKTGHQLQIVTVPDLQGLTVEEYGLKLGRHWAIGRAGVDDGILMIHAIKERKLRIEVGRGAEPYLTDAMSRAIYQRSILPAFKEGKFADGIESGAAAIMREAAISPEQRALDDRRAKDEAASRNAAARQSASRFFFGLGLFLAAAAGLFAAWRLATRKKRAQKAEAERIAALKSHEIRVRREELAAAERHRAALARAAEEKRLRQERQAMLAAMSPAQRAGFLAEEERVRSEAEARRRREAAEQERQDRHEREERSRRAEATQQREQASVTYTSSASPASSPDTSWGGGGGDFGGGGATGDY